MAAVRGSGPPAGMSGWCMCRATAKALSMPARSTDLGPPNTGQSRPARIAASTSRSEPHRFGRPSRYCGSSPMIPFSPLADLRRPSLPDRAVDRPPDTVIAAVKAMLASSSGLGSGGPGGGTHGLTGTGRAGTHLASPDRRAGRGVPGSCEPARSAAVDPGPGAGLAVTELLARVAGSSVAANCPCADQGGRHVDMVVGADHRGRAGGGVWRDAASRPLTARISGPVTASAPAGPGRWRGDRSGGPGPGDEADPSVAGPPGSDTQPGLGSVALGHREQLVAGRPRRMASRSNLWCLSGLHPAVEPGIGAVRQGE